MDGPPKPAVTGPPPRPAVLGPPPRPHLPPSRSPISPLRTPPKRPNIAMRHSCAIPQTTARKALAQTPPATPKRVPPRLPSGASSSNIPRRNVVKKPERSISDPRLKQLQITGVQRNDSSNTCPFRMLKKLLTISIDALSIDDIAKARIEEAVFTSPGFLSLKKSKSISLKQEKELLQILQIIDFLTGLPEV
mmetsp:Transcript_71954/g.108594  ORF Transcript_71954/g.108594 Transcript_71954/m.108594 type:complete len:192 (+) Transcript_71954:44-619(+)